MINFETGEQIIKVVRKHFLIMTPITLAVIAAALAPALLSSFFMSDFLPLDPDFKAAVGGVVDQWQIFAYSVWLLFLWVIFFVEWTDYYLDLWIITNKRIIDVEQKGFFHREVTSFDFTQIQDITVETRGFVETFLKFGTLHIQTAGHNREIIIRDAHYPEDARSLILKLSEQAKSIRGR